MGLVGGVVTEMLCNVRPYVLARVVLMRNVGRFDRDGAGVTSGGIGSAGDNGGEGKVPYPVKILRSSFSDSSNSAPILVVLLASISAASAARIAALSRSLPTCICFSSTSLSAKVLVTANLEESWFIEDDSE